MPRAKEPRPLDDDEREHVEQNRWLALSAARRFARSFPRLDPDEIQSACFLGLAACVRTFDPEKGAFSTHADWWMWDACMDAAASARMVKVPVYQEWPERHKRTAVEKYGDQARRVLDATFLTIVEDYWTSGFVEDREADEAAQHVRVAVGNLSEPHRSIVRRVFLEDEQLKEVARDLGINRNRAAVIRDEGLKWLRLLLA